MEKRTPHCPLHRVKELVQAGNVRRTNTARIGAAALGLDFAGMLSVVLALEQNDFYKSNPRTPTKQSGRMFTGPRHTLGTFI
jgi:motility quorum-sensing regulator/GCU-specific mRNA interferase toxin